MSEKIITENASHHETDEAELRRLESRTEKGADGDEETQIVEIRETEKKKRNFPAWIIALTDEIKTESKAVVAELKSLGAATIMLTGDNHAPAEAVAKEVGITEVKAELLPEHKADAIRELLEKYGAVAMVGDGVNDPPALALSSVGVAMGAAGSDTAIEAASIAILNDRLELVPYLVRLGRKTISTIKINTTLAVATKLVFIILAILGVSSLAMAIFADVGVTILVILNSLRLLRFS